MSSRLLLRTDVESALDQKVRPFLARDAGDIRVAAIDDRGNVTLKLVGRCGGCPIADLELTGMVTDAVTDSSPDVSGVTLDTGVSDGLIAEARALMHHRASPDGLPAQRTSRPIIDR